EPELEQWSRWSHDAHCNRDRDDRWRSHGLIQLVCQPLRLCNPDVNQDSHESKLQADLNLRSHSSASGHPPKQFFFGKNVAQGSTEEEPIHFDFHLVVRSQKAFSQYRATDPLLRSCVATLC